MKKTTKPPLPKIVSRAEWKRARAKLLAKEKAETRRRDALAAERRRLPMVRIEKDYVFKGPDRDVRLLDLFEGRRQLLLYHFMFAPDVQGWPSAGCPGCSLVVDQICHLAHLHARDTSFVLVSACAAGTPQGLPKANGLEHSLVFIGRERFQRRLRRHDQGRRNLRPQRLFARGRRSVSHLFHRWARRRGARGPSGRSSMSRRSAARRIGKIHRRAIRRPSPTNGGDDTMSTLTA